MNTNKSLGSLLLVVASVSVGCAGLGGASSKDTVVRHGSVVTETASVKAIMVGPGVVRAYAGENGGKLFVAEAITGGDEDCAWATAAAAPVAAEKTAILTVRAGEVACLATSSERPYEMLWRARVIDGASPTGFEASAR